MTPQRPTLAGAEELIGVSTAAQEIGTTRFTLGQRIRDEHLPVWLDPLDRRRRLVRRSDLARLTVPRPQRTAPIAQRPTAPEAA